MFLASKDGRVGIAFALLTAGLLIHGFPQIAVASDSHKDGGAVFVIKSEITKIQETLRDKGHYRGKVDGVLGLRTRAGIRAYQKAETLPVTGQVDTQTATRLGVRPESNWDLSASAGLEAAQAGDMAGGDSSSDKPSAGIKWSKGRSGKTLRKPVKTVPAPESSRAEREKTLQAETQ